MKIYCIKKKIQAPDIMTAIQKERKARISDVWEEEEKKEDYTINTHAIGFAVYNDNDEE